MTSASRLRSGAVSADQASDPRRAMRIPALIVLAAMLAAGAVLLHDDVRQREVLRARWQRAAIQEVDAALNDAMLVYLGRGGPVELRVEDSDRTDAAIRYYATEQALDVDGLPRVLSAARTPDWRAGEPLPTGWPGESVNAGSGLLRRYVIERLCTRPGPPSTGACRMVRTSVDPGCRADAGAADSPSACAWREGAGQPYLRITVRIDGQHQAIVYGQALVKPRTASAASVRILTP